MSRVLPILFNTEMVRAILDDRKTVTRRAIKPKYREDEGGFQVCTNKATGERWVEKHDWDEKSFDSPRYVKPPYQPGDILYVREAFCPNYFDESIAGYRSDGLRGNRNAYKADYNKAVVGDAVPEPKWVPSIHMPKEVARIWLLTTGIEIQKLKDITDNDAKQEGFSDRSEFISSFLKMYPSCTLESWLWVISFTKTEKPDF